MESKLLTGIQALVDIQRQWNALWLRSDVTYPGVRAENLAHWMQQFETDRELKLATVWDQERLVAALPLHDKVGKFGMQIWSLTCNCWADAGDVMLDQEYPSEDLCDALVNALGTDVWNLLKLGSIAVETPRWQSFIGALRSKGHRLRESVGDAIALTDVLHDWPAYQASWSGNHRAAVKKSIKRLKSMGDLQAECFRTGEEAELNSILEACFLVEDRTWKGENGTSIVKSDMQDYFHEEARIMMQNDMLHLWQLKLDGQLIAFEYCPVAKGVVYSNKISFDPDHSRNSPGNVLRFFQHEFYQQQSQYHLFDMMGITCKNKAKWSTRVYATGNVTAAKGIRGNVALAIANWSKPPVSEVEELPPLGARSYLETASSQSAPDHEQPPVAIAIDLAPTTDSSNPPVGS